MEVLRNELKYYISQPEYRLLVNVLDSLLPPDKYSQNGCYHVRSLYFDTLHDKAFYEKMYGVGRRKKYRLRIYSVDDQKVKFEIKNKVKEKINKETAIISREDALSVINGDADPHLKYNNKILNKIYCDFKRDPFRPVVMVDYLRKAFTYDINRIRITFDQELSSDISNFDIFRKPINPKSILKAGLVIMEVKYNDYLPDWIKDALGIVTSTRSAISKYCLSRIETGGDSYAA